MSVAMYNSMYEGGALTIKDMMLLVDKGKISSDDFHFITGLSYRVLKEKERKAGGAD